jgi:hypothetical protein
MCCFWLLLRSPALLVDGVARVGFSGTTRRVRWVAAVASTAFGAEGPRGLPTGFEAIFSVLVEEDTVLRRDDRNVRHATRP